MVLSGISSFLSTSSALLLFETFHFCLSLLHFMYIMTGAFILIVAVVLVLVFSCFFYLDSLTSFSAYRSCILTFSLDLFYTLSFPFSTLFYMFCR